MFRSIVLLALYLCSTSGHIVSKPSSHYSDVLKIKCEALPCRSVYFDRMCFFVIDSDGDISKASKKCSTMLTGAQFAKPSKASDEIWSSLLVEKTVFLSDSDVKGKTKAMCFLENEFPTSTGVHTNTHKRSIRKGEKLVARWNMPVLAKFTDPLEVGQTIIIKGAFGLNEVRPSFNLMLNDMESVAIHVFIEFDQGRYGIDTSNWYNQWDGMWAQIGPKPIPFWRGGPFDIRFRVNEDHFQLLINEQECEKYKFRKPLSTINHFWVYGTGYVNYLQLGEKYDPVPKSITLKTSHSDSTTKEGQNWAVMPFAWKFPDPLEVGQTIIVKGTFNPSDSRPYFNLQENHQVSIPFHIFIEFNNNRVGMDTYSGQWQGAWQQAQKPNPFKQGETFDIRFRVNQDHFLVFVSEKEFATYNFRLPLALINYFYAFGISNVTFLKLGEKYKPVRLNPPEHTFGEFPVCGKDTCSAKREIDVKTDLPTDCKTIFITGYFKSYAWDTYYSRVAPARFQIDIKRKNGEIAMRIEPRFDQNVVAFNNYKNGAWGEDEIVNKLPFVRDIKFQIAVTNEASGFQVSVDGKYFATFKHRTCPNDIGVVEVGPRVYDVGIQM